MAATSFPTGPGLAWSWTGTTSTATGRTAEHEHRCRHRGGGGGRRDRRRPAQATTVTTGASSWQPERGHAGERADKPFLKALVQDSRVRCLRLLVVPVATRGAGPRVLADGKPHLRDMPESQV